MRSYLIVFDIGSGSCKGGLACYDTRGVSASTPDGARGRVDMLYEREVPSLLGHALESGRSGGQPVIPLKAVRRLHECMDLLFVEAREAFDKHSRCAPDSRASSPPLFEDLPRVGVCTAVFRETENGPAVMEDLSRRYCCALRLIGQKQEGVLGYLTGVAAASELSHHSSNAALRAVAARITQGNSRPVVWDSGGASFQLTGHDGALTTPDSLVVFEGPWGSSKAVRAAVTNIQGKTFGAGHTSANPMSKTEVVATIDWIYCDLCEREKSMVDAARHATAVRALLSREAPPLLLGIGGDTCAFRMAMLLLKKSHPNNAPTFGKPDTVRSHFRIEVSALLEATLSSRTLLRSDAEFADMGFPQPEMVLPKLCLVLAVLKYFDVREFTFVQTCGILQGLALTTGDEMFGQPADVVRTGSVVSRL